MTANEIINNFALTETLKDIPDIFNDKLDFSCQNFIDIKKLNKEMLQIAMKYKLFDGSKSSLEVLGQFKENFELLQAGLEKLVKQLINKELTLDMQHQINEINKNFKSISNEVDMSAVIGKLFYYKII